MRKKKYNNLNSKQTYFNMQKPQELLHNLRQFTGTTVWYKHPLFAKCVYTEGVRYLAINAECYWLLEYIFSHQKDAKIKAEEFQVWTIVRNGSKATIKVGDGNDNIVKTFRLSYTSFPLEEYSLWMIQGRLLLKNEY